MPWSGNVKPLRTMEAWCEGQGGGDGITDELGLLTSFGALDVMFVADEIPPARRFGEVLGPSHEWDEVENGVRRAAQKAFAAHGRAKCRQRDKAANPRHCPVEPLRGSSRRVLLKLPSHSHAATYEQGSFRLGC